MKKCKIIVPVGCRSDIGLSAPIIKRLKEAEWCHCIKIFLVPANFNESYESTEFMINEGIEGKPDLILCVGDRIEMCASATAAYHNHIPIAHFYAGIIDYSFVVFDDINRHVITLYADIAFCESEKAMNIVADLWSSIGKGDICYFYDCDTNFEGSNIYNVGISHLDDLEIDESLVPDEPYNLILINAETTIQKEFYLTNINPILHLIFIGSNPDKKIEFNNILFEGDPNHPLRTTQYYDNLPRSQFFGLLSKANRFITNSSSAYYEAPHFLKPEQIIMVGKRNLKRSTPTKLETGASDKIVKILEKWWRDKNEF